MSNQRAPETKRGPCDMLDDCAFYLRTEQGLEAAAQEIEAVKSLITDVADFVADSECRCLPETEKYAAHTCQRCELLDRLRSAP